MYMSVAISLLGEGLRKTDREKVALTKANTV